MAGKMAVKMAGKMAVKMAVKNGCQNGCQNEVKIIDNGVVVCCLLSAVCCWSLPMVSPYKFLVKMN